MDQDAFRHLLSTSSSARKQPTPGHSSGFTYGSKSKQQQEGKKSKTIDASQPAFKPRKVKADSGESEGRYRDRAAERRGGEGNEFSAAEALLAELQKNTADKRDLEEKRQYLGGDGTHSILVKGLDIALLEQNKARQTTMPTGDDEDLENAFLGISTAGGVDGNDDDRNVGNDAVAHSQQSKKKRTREELVKELKSNRVGGNGSASADVNAPGGGDKHLEDAKKQGRFKPIGFKPIGSSSAPGTGGAVAEEGKEKKKKKRVKGDGEEKTKDGDRKKKKRKVEPGGEAVSTTNTLALDDVKGNNVEMPSGESSTTPNEKTVESTPRPPEPAPIDEDLDIFAGAGDYDDLLSADESGSDTEKKAKARVVDEESKSTRDDGAGRNGSAPRRWIPTEDDEEYIPRPFQSTGASTAGPSGNGTATSGPGGQDTSTNEMDGEEGEIGQRRPQTVVEEDEDEEPMRLQPLASSALPSIKEFLAMEEAAEAAEKRKKRKEKNKKKAGEGGGEAGSKMSAEARADRDYKRLKSYQEKKGGS